MGTGIDSSFSAVKKALHTGDYFYGNLDVSVSIGDEICVYRDVSVTVSYNIGYMQMDVTIILLKIRI